MRPNELQLTMPPSGSRRPVWKGGILPFVICVVTIVNHDIHRVKFQQVSTDVEYTSRSPPSAGAGPHQWSHTPKVRQHRTWHHILMAHSISWLVSKLSRPSEFSGSSVRNASQNCGKPTLREAEMWGITGGTLISPFPSC